MAHTTIRYMDEWDTLHENGPFPLKRLLETFPESNTNMPAAFDRYNDNSKEIQRLIKECMDRGEGFRAYGSRWSLSDIAHQKDNMHRNHSMNLKLGIKSNEMHQDSNYKSENLFLFECGNRIKEISQALLGNKKSLKTSGASNGQTIAGVISTGVHGSAIDVGSVQDSVVGLNLIIGPREQDVVYIERKSKPALNDAFGTKINARIIRDDDMFNAALVGLGSFGFIHGVVMETEDIYLLKRYIGSIKKSDTVRLGSTMDFCDATTIIDTPFDEIKEEVDEQNRGIRPYHYKLYVNPYLKNGEEIITEIIYKKPYRTNYKNPIPLMNNNVSPDLLSFMSNLMAKNNWSVPLFLRITREQLFPQPKDKAVEGTLGEIFWDSIHQGAALAFSVGIDHKYVKEGLDIFYNTLKDKKKGRLPAAIGVRFVKGSEGTLAFTKFPVTCAIEINGTLPRKNKRSRNAAKQKVVDFSKSVMEQLEKKGIPFTLHWGKNADWSYPNLVNKMYGSEKVKSWKANRKKLLQAAGTEAFFANDFIKRLNLY